MTTETRPLTNRSPRTDLWLMLAALVFAAAGLAVTAANVTPARASTAHQIVMSGYAFSPRSLTITAGDTVVWTNEDTAPHDVKTTSGPAAVHSPMLSKGGTWSHTFTTPGTYSYVCTVHPGMTAQLVVEPAATATRPAHTHTSAPMRMPTHTAGAAPARTSHDHTPGHTPSAAPKTSAASAAAAAPSAAVPSPSEQSEQTTTLSSDPASASVRPLDPLLLLTGIVAGIAVLCLLLVGSRSSAARLRDTREPQES